MEANAAHRRVVLTGSECTGKTTLARALAEHFGAPLSLEYAREYAEKKPELTAEDVEPIARGQLALEDGARGPLVIRDTDLVSTVVYARAYYGDCPPWIVDAARARLAELYLLCDIDVPWTADGVRDLPHARAAMQARFRETLRALGANVVELRGTFDGRRARAIAAIDALQR